MTLALDLAHLVVVVAALFFAGPGTIAQHLDGIRQGADLVGAVDGGNGRVVIAPR